MFFIPAIDLIDGQCVRLLQGDYSKKTEYSHDPVGIAKSFEDQGAKYIHIVDLDAAKGGSKNNSKVIKNVVHALKIPVQVGGGVRDRNKIISLYKVLIIYRTNDINHAVAIVQHLKSKKNTKIGFSSALNTKGIGTIF